MNIYIGILSFKPVTLLQGGKFPSICAKKEKGEERLKKWLFFYKEVIHQFHIAALLRMLCFGRLVINENQWLSGA